MLILDAVFTIHNLVTKWINTLDTLDTLRLRSEVRGMSMILFHLWRVKYWELYLEASSKGKYRNSNEFVEQTEFTIICPCTLLWSDRRDFGKLKATYFEKKKKKHLLDAYSGRLQLTAWSVYCKIITIVEAIQCRE